MTNKNFTTEITYNENCHYNESIQSQTISVPLDSPTITVTKISEHNDDGDLNFYYNDPIQLNVSVVPEYGSLSFYFVEKSDPLKEKKIINDNPISVDKNGMASIKYIPHGDGTFIIEYDGSPYYENNTITEEIVLLPRPIIVNFNKHPPYLTNPEEAIDLSVTVIDEKNDEELDYGLVTFLNYYVYDINDPNDGREKVIGNPQYLIDGVAKIKYSPIQSSNQNNLLNNIELIRAVYNYNNTAYGITWDYYGQNDNWTAISIGHANQVNICTPQKKIEEQCYQDLEINDKAIFVSEENDSIYLKCYINVDNDNSIIIDQANVNFIAQRQDTKIILPATKSLLEDNCYEYVTSSDELQKGIYSIHAEVDNCIDANGKIIPINDSNTNLPNSIQDGIFLKSNISDNFFIEITPRTSILNLELATQHTLITDYTIHADDLMLNITKYPDGSGDPAFSDDDAYVLNGKKCYFYISGIDTTYQGIIHLSFNEETEPILMAKPDDDILINLIGDYEIYAYIKKDIYQGKNDFDETIERAYNTTSSNKIVIKIRNQLNINLNPHTINKKYPNEIQYILEGTNININDTIYCTPQIGDLILEPIILTKNDSTYVGTIPLCQPGTYTFRVEIKDEDNNYIGTESFDFEVEKNDLIIDLDSSNKNMFSTSSAIIFLNIKNETKTSIGMLDLSKLHVTIVYNESNKEKEIVLPNESIYTDNKQYQINIPCNLYDSGAWTVKVEYDGDDYYNELNSQSIEFNVFNEQPYVYVDSFDENNFNNVVAYIQNTQYIEEEINGVTTIRKQNSYETYNQYILILSTISKDGRDPISFVNITDQDGKYTLTKPNNMSSQTWAEYNILEYQILPKYSVFNDSDNEESNIVIFKEEFENYIDTDEKIQQLYNQAKQNQFVTLFTGYKETEDLIQLFGGENDAT